MEKHLLYNAQLDQRIDLTDKLTIFRVRPQAEWLEEHGGVLPAFHGGQYIALGLNNTADPALGAVQRLYSIASPPTQRDYFEFYIRYVDRPASHNPLTHLLWQLEPGDPLWLGKKTAGHFTLEHSLPPGDTRIKLFVAAGTGVAPFISMLGETTAAGIPARQFAVIHGVSRTEDLGYRHELESLFASAPAHYLPTVSRPEESPDWHGHTGRAESLFDADHLSELEHRLGLKPGEFTPLNVAVFICGLNGTIHNTVLSLLRHGFVPSDRAIRKALNLLEIPPSSFFEQYDNEPIFKLDDSEAMRGLLAETPFAGRLD